MLAKYYIYAGGRWCEVDTRRGRVAGWRQRARFCFLRGGRLEVARSAPVLRALRSLATGAGSAARDAAPLPYSRRHRPRRESVAPAHVCCAHHLHHSRCDLNANEFGDKPPPAIQAVVPPVSFPQKRKRSTSEDLPNEAKEAKKQKPSPQHKNARVTEDDKLVHILLHSSSEDNGKQKRSQNSKPAVLRRKESSQNSQSSERNKRQRKEGKIVVLTRSKEEERLVKSLLQSSSDETDKRQKKSQKLHRSPQKSPQKPSKTVRSETVEKVVQSLLQSSSAEGNAKEQVFKRPQTARRPKFRNYRSDSSSTVSVRKDGPCKELIIDECDVALLRSFLSKTVDILDLDRFDNDDAYKTRLFYKLNPLVTLQRSAQMEQLLRHRVSLKEFAKQLGLRSVADLTPEKRYRMRDSTRKARHVTSNSETDKENVVQPKRRQLWNRDKVVFNSFRSSRASDVRGRPKTPKPVRESSPDSSDSDTEVKQHIKRNLERRASARLNPRHGEEQTRTRKDESILVSDDSDSHDSEQKSRQTKARKEKAYESVVVSDDSNENKRKSRKRTRSESRTANETESVVVSDESDSDSNENGEKSTKGTTTVNRAVKDNNSVVVSDKSDSNTDENSEKSARKARTVNKAKYNESVVVSDESESTDENRRSNRRTRSQGPEKRQLREHNKSVVISDDTDSDGNENRASNATVAKTQAKPVVSDDINHSDENRGKTRRTRSTGPDRVLKEQNNDSNSKKVTDNKTKKEAENSIKLRTTRSSMKGADDSKTKEKTKAVTPKKDQPTSSKREISNRKEDKPNKEVAKESSKKADTMKDQDKSVISDSDNAFDTSKSSPRKRTSFGDLIKNIKGRFYKTSSKSSENKQGNKNDKGNKSSEHRIKQDNSNESKTRDRRMENGKVMKRKGENNNERYTRDKQKDEKADKSEHRPDKERIKTQQKKGPDNSNKDKNEKSAVAKMFVKPVKFKKSCVANGREYTSLEDHAIVAWISVGGRERMVNGNAIWRDLQQEYPKITSQTRSWHSLRNRYLRYILPSLASLALPPAQVSRLRAAAATGKLKSSPGYRRNSIFNIPRVHSAAARRPQGSSSEDRRERTPSPRRPRLASPSKLAPSKRASPPSPAAPPTRLRPRGPAHTPTQLQTSTPTPQKRRIHHL